MAQPREDKAQNGIPYASDSSKPFEAMVSTMNGACLCEDIQFAVRGKPDAVFLCHCAHCSKNAGASGQSAKFKREDVEVTTGRELSKVCILRDTLSGSEKHKIFCSQCGCTLWTIPMMYGGSYFIVRTALIEDGLKRLPCTMEVFTSRKVETDTASLESFDTMPGQY